MKQTKLLVRQIDLIQHIESGMMVLDRSPRALGFM